jgi:hypothetical protein
MPLLVLMVALFFGWTLPTVQAGLPPGADAIPMYVTNYANPTCGGVPVLEGAIPYSHVCLPANNPDIVLSGPRFSSAAFHSIFISCRKGGFYRTYASSDCTGTPLKVFPSIKKNIVAYCLHDLVISTRISCRPPAADCGPSLSLNKKACDKRIRKCGSLPGGGLKWVGRGCRSDSGDRFQDGGCQCVGFCGYGCEGKCRADNECAWNATLNACTVKGTDVPAGAITNCQPPAPPPAPPRGSPTIIDSLLG